MNPSNSIKTGQFLKVYLYRGFIGLPKSIREHAKCLGLTKRFRTVYIPAVPIAVGNLLKIKELGKVELVNEKPIPRIGSSLYPKGYQVSTTTTTTTASSSSSSSFYLPTSSKSFQFRS